jgi:uncharacterized membrane protein
MQDDQIEGSAPQPPTRSGWIRPVLMFSLALNAAVIAMIAGVLLRDDGPRRGSGPPALAAFGRPYVQALPRDDRRAILRALRAQQGADLPDRAARRALFDDVLAALEARPFDAAALAAAVGRQAEVSVTLQERVRLAWLAHVTAMSEQERLEYARAIRAELARSPRAGREDR